MVSASISSDASFRKSPAPFPLAPPPTESYSIDSTPHLSLSSPAAGTSSPLSTSSTHAHRFIFLTRHSSLIPIPCLYLFPTLYPFYACISCRFSVTIHILKFWIHRTTHMRRGCGKLNPHPDSRSDGHDHSHTTLYFHQL